MKKNIFAYRSFWPELEAMKKFNERGIETITFFPSNSANSLGEPYSKYKNNWLWFGEYDFDEVDRQINDILTVSPNAKLITVIDLNTPLWLQRQMADVNADSFTNLSEAICNPLWVEYMSTYLTAIVKYLEGKYGDRIISYTLAAGYTDEWMDYSNGAESADKLFEYNKWRSQNNLPVVKNIPTLYEREHITHFGTFRDPQIDRDALDYWRFTSEIIVEKICHFADITRSLIRKDVSIGVFYGYILELCVKRLVKAGHLAYEKLLASKKINYLISPATYTSRRMGDGGGFMMPESTIEKYDCFYMHECDQRTHCYNANLTQFVKLEMRNWEDLTEDIVGMRREMSQSLIKHTSLWWFDMWGGYYQDKKVFDNLEKMREIWDKYSEEKAESRAEIALVVDPDSTYYLDDLDANSKYVHVNTHIRNELNKIGAVYKVFSFNDMDTEAFKRCKFIIFPCLLDMNKEKEEFMNKYARNENKTILYLGKSAIFYENKYAPDYMEKITGFNINSQELGEKKLENHTTVFYPVAMDMTKELLRDLIEKAGVFTYVPNDNVVYGNEKFICVHTKYSGVTKINFPQDVKQVTELFSNIVYDVKNNCIEYNFNAPETLLFKIN